MSTATETSWKADDNPDRFGEELGDEAHIWRVYKDVADADDKNRIDNWNRGLDNLALFAGLLSAVTSAFLIEARKDLTPDPILETLRSIDARLYNKTFTADGSGAPIPRAVNLLWVASLILSLTAALIAIMGKDWIGMYVKMPPCNLRQRADIRTFRLRCVERWHMSGVISTAPVLLHISLLLFGSGLVAFMALDTATLIFASLVSGIVFALYAFIIVNAILSPTSPFQSPATQALRQLFGLAAEDAAARSIRERLASLISKRTLRSARVRLASCILSSARTLRSAPDRLASCIPNRTQRSQRDEEDAPVAEHRLHGLPPSGQQSSGTPISQTQGASHVQRPQPIDIDATHAEVTVHGGHDVAVGQQLSGETGTNAPPVAQPSPMQAGSDKEAPESVDARTGIAPALPHWNAIPAVNPDRMLQSLVWLRDASSHPWVERSIITALGDRTIFTGPWDRHSVPPSDRSSLTVPKGQILGYQVARRLSDDYLQAARAPVKEVRLREAFRDKLPKRIVWSRTDLLAVLRYIRLRNNRPDAGMAEPENTQLNAVLSDALLDDRISPEQYIYAVCLAANREGITIDLDKLKKHCEHTDLALTTASFLMALLYPPLDAPKPPYNELLVMTKCFGWHRRPAHAPLFPSVLKTHLPRTLPDSAGGASVPGASAEDVDLLSHIILHYVGVACSDGLYILLDLLESRPVSDKYWRLFHLFDTRKNPAASQAIWTICRESPGHALRLMNALPSERLYVSHMRPLDLDILTRNVVAIALSRLVPPTQQFPTLQSLRKGIFSDIGNGTAVPDARGISVIRTFLSYSSLTHPLTPVDCDWALLANIATYLAHRIDQPLPEDKDQRSRAESELQEVTNLVKLLIAVGPNVGGRERGDGSEYCNLGRLLLDLSKRVALSREIAHSLRALDKLRQVCQKSLPSDMAAYPSYQALIDQWTTINPEEPSLEESEQRPSWPPWIRARDIDIRKATFRGVIVAVKELKHATLSTTHKIGAACSQLRTLNHENIILLIGVGDDRSRFLRTYRMVFFPWAENGTVLEYTAKSPGADRLQLILDVASGLTYIHSRTPQILHMRVNPSHILVDNTGRALIGGFGMSIMLPEARYTARMWLESFRCNAPPGELSYEAPELRKEDGVCSSAVDVFGWAMTAVEILSGVKPLGRREFSMESRRENPYSIQFYPTHRSETSDETEDLGPTTDLDDIEDLDEDETEDVDETEDRDEDDTENLDETEDTRPLWMDHWECSGMGLEASLLLKRCWPLLERGWAMDPDKRTSMEDAVQELTAIKATRPRVAAAEDSVPVASTSGTQ